MVKRFRLVAGPNGSGKSTLKGRLEADYAVNFYDFVCADDIFAEVKRTGAYSPRISIEAQALIDYAKASSYEESVRRQFESGAIVVEDDCVRFTKPESITSYTVALLASFLQEEHIRQGVSFSQETVFSHPSKVEALKAAKAAGFRTYLYYVATDSSLLNVLRVLERALQGGHSVPADKVRARYARSLEQVQDALPFLDRAFFFDNGDMTMRYLASWTPGGGLAACEGEEKLPRWFLKMFPSVGRETVPAETRLAASAVAASREAVGRTFAAGRAVAALRRGRVVLVSENGTEAPVEENECSGKEKA